MKPQSALPKAQVTLALHLFQRDGYSFLEWNTSASGQGTRYADGATLTMPPQDVTLNAQWAPDPHQVTFDPNGGEGTMAAQTLGTGQTAALATHGFFRDGYRFSGWNTAATGNGTTYAEAAPFTMGKAGVTLYAQWVGIDTAVSFYPNGGDGAPRFQVAPTGTLLKLDANTYTLRGYLFTGWNTDPAGGGTAWADGAGLTLGPSGLSLYAQWAPRSNTVVFQANGGAGTMAVLTAATHSSVWLPAAAFSRDGYSFAGWNTQERGGGTAYADGAGFTMGADSVTLYAQWTPRTNTLAFQANGGTGTMASQTLATGATVTLPQVRFYRDGYTFAGWNTLAGGAGAGYAEGAEFSMGTASTTLYAQWTANRNLVRFDPRQGLGTMEPQSIETGATAALNPVTFTRAGYTFVTWTTGYNGDGTAYADGAPYTMGVDHVWLYAQWRAQLQTVTFDPNGGSGTMAPIQAATDESFTPPSSAFVRSGYDFVGWNTRPAGGGTAYPVGRSTRMGPSGVVLYAQWSVQYHRVTFEPNGGTGSLSMSSQPTGATITLPANTMTRQGYLFAGWNTQASGGGATYANAGTLMIDTTDLVLYAQWLPFRWTGITYESTRTPSDAYGPTTCAAYDGTTLLVGTRGRIGTSGSVVGGGLVLTTDRGQTWTQFTVADGLADSEVWGVAVSGSSYYAATTRGLSVSRDAGATWSTWTATSGLADEVTYSVSVSGDAIAVGTLSGVSLSFDRGGSWSNSSTAQGMGDRLVREVKVAAGKVYAATDGGLSISSDSGASWVNFTKAQGLPGNQVRGVAVTSAGIWAATSAGASFSPDGGATWSTSRISSWVNSWPCVAVATDGTSVCFATNSGLAVTPDEGLHWDIYEEHRGLADRDIQGSAVLGGTITAATAGGVALSFDAGVTWTNHGVARALGANAVNQVVASEGRLYAATAGGLSVSADGGASWTNLSKADGLAGSAVRGVAVVGPRVYAVTGAWLSVSPDGGATWSKVNPFNSQSTLNELTSVAASGTTVWAGCGAGAFYSTDSGATWSTVTASNGLNSNSVNAVAVDGSVVAVAAGYGLSLSSDGGRTWRTTLAHQSVGSVTLAGSKVYANSSVSSDGGATWKPLGVMDGNTSLPLEDLAVDGTNLYAATDRGVFVSSDGGATWNKNDRAQGLPSDWVRQISVVDSKIYAATAGGVAIGTLGR